MQIVLVGANHRSCPIEIRERLAFRTEHLPEAYASLRRDVGASEALILSTCNRVEIYAGVPESRDTLSQLSTFLSRHGQLDQSVLTPQLYTYEEPRSIEHLFSVASGLDSMVLGEAEILHQVKHAYELARQHGLTGKVLNGLFQRALNTAKTVRAKTSLGEGSLSIGSVALEFAQKIFGDLRSFTVLLIGAGKIGELTLRRLIDRGVVDIRIVNRSSARATALAGLYGASAHDVSDLPDQLLAADIAITSTSAPGVLLSRTMIASLLATRRHRPLCLIDLGVPRNIDPTVEELENVYLFDIDDLQGLVEQYRQQRQEAVLESQTIISQKVSHFVTWRQKELTRCAASPSALAEAL